MSVLAKNVFFVKEHKNITSPLNNYDIVDPSNHNNILLEVREENLGGFDSILRFSALSAATPFNIIIKEPNGATLCTLSRGTTMFNSKVGIADGSGNPLATFETDFFAVFRAKAFLKVLDPSGNELFTIRSKAGLEPDYIVEEKGQAIAKITKKWAGLFQELFTSADNYAIEIQESVPADDPKRLIILACCICIDMIMYER
ncbi:MAG: phospholipid scramblase family protein [Bacteroidia bacterium]|nr:phospholipid scramblase family protein [Bacteroidia bacterium]